MPQRLLVPECRRDDFGGLGGGGEGDHDTPIHGQGEAGGLKVGLVMLVPFVDIWTGEERGRGESG